MIIVLAQTKGGVGKSTLAVNLAIARSLGGGDTLLVDADEQATATDFTALRTERLGNPGYTAISSPALPFGRTFSALLPNTRTSSLMQVGGTQLPFGRHSPSLIPPLFLFNREALICGRLIKSSPSSQRQKGIERRHFARSPSSILPIPLARITLRQAQS